MVKCYDCKGIGYTVFLGKESICPGCRGAGELQICDAFAMNPNKVVVFRNQSCYKCGVRQNDHNIVQVSL